MKEEYLKYFHLKLINKGAYFHQENTICDKIGFVKKGLFKSFINTESGEERIVEFYYENKFVSAFTSFLSGRITDWNIQALEDSEIYFISKENLNILYAKNPEWVELGLRIFEEQTLKKCNREKSLLVDDAKGRYKIFQNEYSQIENRIRQKDIAHYLGITTETLSRIKNSKY